MSRSLCLLVLSACVLAAVVQAAGKAPKKQCIEPHQLKEANAATEKLESKVAALTEQLEEAKSSAATHKSAAEKANAATEKRESKVAALTEQLEEAKSSAATHKSAAEKAQSTIGSLELQLEEKLASAASAAEASTGAAEKKARICDGEVKNLKASLDQSAKLLEASDVQSYLKMRTTAHAGMESLQAYTATSMEMASERLGKAEVEAARMYAKAAPAIVDTHTKVSEAAAVHLTTASGHFKWGLETVEGHAEKALTALEEHVPAIKPKISLLSSITAHVVILLPAGGILLAIVFMLVRRMGHLLCKVDFSITFVLLSAVFTVCGAAAALKKDPILALRTAAPAAYTSAAISVAVLGGVLAAVQSSVLLSSAKTSKAMPAQFMSLLAAVLNIAFFLHFYNLVHKKALADPTFEVSFAIKGDGSPSFVEYGVFYLVVALLTWMGSPSSFRFSLRALIMALEGLVVGHGLALTAMAAAIGEDPVATLLRNDMYKYAAAGVLAVLFGVLALRTLSALFFGTGFITKVMHLALAAFSMWRVVKIPLGNITTGTTTPLGLPTIVQGVCGLVLLLVLQVIFIAYGGDAVAKPALPKAQAAKAAEHKKHGKHGKK